MKSKISLLLAATLAALFASCSPVSVTTDYDTSAPFKKYKTYALAPAAKGQSLSPSSEAALRDTLRSELAKKGLTEKTSGKPDIAIARHVSTKEKLAVHEYTDYGYPYAGTWPYGYGRYSPWVGAPRSYVDVSQYTEGTLVLDFIDTQSNKLVFRGTGSAMVGKPETNAKTIGEAVTRIIADFPTR
jgi:hypothetical protein